jgi:hypothetical protein
VLAAPSKYNPRRQGYRPEDARSQTPGISFKCGNYRGRYSHSLLRADELKLESIAFLPGSQCSVPG